MGGGKKKGEGKKDKAVAAVGPDLEHLLNQIPNAKIDHVERSQLLTEQIGKEKTAMHKLSSLNLALNDTNSQAQVQPKFSVNPYNRSRQNTSFNFMGWELKKKG